MLGLVTGFLIYPISNSLSAEFRNTLPDRQCVASCNIVALPGIRFHPNKRRPSHLLSLQKPLGACTKMVWFSSILLGPSILSR